MELTLDEKLECVLLHLNDNLPLHTISKERGINVARLKYCIKLYINGRSWFQEERGKKNIHLRNKIKSNRRSYY